LTLEQHIIAAQVNARRLARSVQLLQVPVAELSLLVFLVANRLRVGDPLGYGDRIGG
jgi:hypothetical protein